MSIRVSTRAWLEIARAIDLGDSTHAVQLLGGTYCVRYAWKRDICLNLNGVGFTFGGYQRAVSISDTSYSLYQPTWITDLIWQTYMIFKDPSPPTVSSYLSETFFLMKKQADELASSMVGRAREGDIVRRHVAAQVSPTIKNALTGDSDAAEILQDNYRSVFETAMSIEKESLPLFVNHGCILLSAIARWRLQLSDPVLVLKMLPKVKNGSGRGMIAAVSRRSEIVLCPSDELCKITTA